MAEITGSAGAPIGERMTRVETRLDGIEAAVRDGQDMFHAGLKEVKDMISDQNARSRQDKMNNRTAVYTVIALMIAIPSSISASIAVYHLAEPTHTIVQKIDSPSP